MLKRRGVFLAGVIFLAFMAAPSQPYTPEDIEASIEAGINWLVSVQQVGGYWEGSYISDRFGTTGLVLVKLQDRAFELGYDGPFDPLYPFKANVVAGLDYLFHYASSTPISMQTAGDPDADGDGLGVTVGNRTYDTAILMMAIAAGRDPAQVVGVAPLTGWTYGDVLQDLADWMAFAQADYGDSRGGWFYNAVNNGSAADQSNAGYAMLGLLYARAPLYGYESVIPAFVASELNFWIDYIQNDVGVGDPQFDGGSAYYPGYDEDYWVNSLKTGNLLTQMAFFGDSSSDTRVQDALDYIGRHWNDNWVQGWGKTGTVQYQATYCLMKGLETMGIPLDGVPGVADWYQEMADEILAEQDVGGFWPSNPAYVWPNGSLGHIVSPELATVWALLTLERFAPPPAVIEVSADIKPGSCPNAFNPTAKGVLPVAILGTADFDVTTIDPASIKLEGTVAPLRWAYEDVGTPFEGELCDCHELGADGYLDLTLKFDTPEVAAALGLVNDGDVIKITFSGFLKEEFGGTEIHGQDCILIRMR